MKATFHNTSIKGIYTIVPPKVIDIDSELDTIYKGDKKGLERIKKVIGLQTRHIAEKHITASDLGLQAATRLLESLEVERDSIDALIFVTQSPDYFCPASACYLQGKLGLSQSCLSFDINQACAGYLYGLYVAHSLCDSGGANRVLLIVGDTLSKFVNPLDSNLAPMMGDGVSATLLERSSNSSLGNHSGDFVDFGATADLMSSSAPKSTKSPTNITALVRSTSPYLQNTRIVDSAIAESHATSAPCHTEPLGEVSHIESKRDFSPFSKAQNDKTPESQADSTKLDSSNCTNTTAKVSWSDFKGCEALIAETSRKGCRTSAKQISRKSTQEATQNKHYFELGSDGSKFHQLIIPEGACRIPTKEIITDSKVWQTSETRSLKDLYMDGAEIFSFAVSTYPKTFQGIIDYAQCDKEAIDYFFFHQANKYIVDNITRSLGLPKEKVPNTTTNKYGNLSGCSIPATICDTLAELASNGLETPLRVHLAGFGAGLAWGNAVVTLDKGFKCQKVGVYE
ncbi:3-oxoacyl-ACP synthase [Helicobacter bilis]|uniref:3-oxoacyl-ACP synthase n=2 Tax=Helicobacter bilis TaxID=37372 RepID=A0A6D2C6N1_9HELI|nr:3-oxoacyl-[acyl-carrier-protein] synthase III C-terminal domain-containing protein [Helicobacter bilis]EMZ41318.1 3-oxoacyl-[acyl-carrier-protein] synthase III [Helicobacter bilis WiWa]TLE04638.1 3-oxoacyl-ACP synthase [Helicobacter bilis]TLE05811.1 3-oxoacyl-ACP synthase [Helicobacter bilis]